jgi:hypothetical protein
LLFERRAAISLAESMAKQQTTRNKQPTRSMTGAAPPAPDAAGRLNGGD